LIKTRKICKTCGVEKTLGDFGYHSCICKECAAKTRTKELAAKRKVNKQKQEIYKIMQEFYKEDCGNDCDNCDFNPWCQRVLDVFNDTNWSEGEK